MLAIFDFVPAHCPNCGDKLQVIGSDVSLYFSGVTMQCLVCGLEHKLSQELLEDIREQRIEALAKWQGSDSQRRLR